MRGLEKEITTRPHDLRNRPAAPLPDLVSTGGTDDDASISSSDSSTLGIVHKSEGDMWDDHSSVIIEPVKKEQALIASIKLLREQNIPSKISNISELDDLDPDYVESQGFAYLAARFCNELPSAFPSTTGARSANICGCLVRP